MSKDELDAAFLQFVRTILPNIAAENMAGSAMSFDDTGLISTGAAQKIKSARYATVDSTL